MSRQLLSMIHVALVLILVVSVGMVILGRSNPVRAANSEVSFSERTFIP